jgi:hypothetical protein
MITGGAAAGQLPRGKVQLAPVDVAANMSPGECWFVRFGSYYYSAVVLWAVGLL